MIVVEIVKNWLKKKKKKDKIIRYFIPCCLLYFMWVCVHARLIHVARGKEKKETKSKNMKVIKIIEKVENIKIIETKYE